MASLTLLPHPPPSLSHSSSSSLFRPRCYIHLLTPKPSQRWPSLVVKSAVDVADPSPSSSTYAGDTSDSVPSLKLNLLAVINNCMQSAVSGLNRGLAANEDDLRKADDAAKELEAAGGVVDLSVGLDKLQ
ncbi:plastid-lipid-associated protein 6 [Spatholobus suberectus]|nr:plastid-lipid-associated protein 6 [Spatholobus suberectus]